MHAYIPVFHINYCFLQFAGIEGKHNILDSCIYQDLENNKQILDFIKGLGIKYKIKFNETIININM